MCVQIEFFYTYRFKVVHFFHVAQQLIFKFFICSMQQYFFTTRAATSYMFATWQSIVCSINISYLDLSARTQLIAQFTLSMKRVTAIIRRSKKKRTLSIWLSVNQGRLPISFIFSAILWNERMNEKREMGTASALESRKCTAESAISQSVQRKTTDSGSLHVTSRAFSPLKCFRLNSIR